MIDVVVVGGGPTGSMLAGELMRGGRGLLLDQTGRHGGRLGRSG